MSEETPVPAIPLREILGQNHAVATLQKAIESERFPNGFLFVGPAGVGKATTALAFAAAANCGSGESSSGGGLFGAAEPVARSTGDRCGTCISCQKIAHGNHPDVRVLSKQAREDAEGKRVRDLTVEQIRPVLAELAYSPYEGRLRVIIIDGAHDLNASAQNVLLKSLEEPPGHTVFILTTDQPRRLLPTIHSRTQTVRFARISAEHAAKLVAERRDIGDAEAHAILSSVGGSLGRALGSEAELYSTNAREEVFRQLMTAVKGRGSEALDIAEAWAQDAEATGPRLSIVAGFFRDGRASLETTDRTDLMHPDLLAVTATLKQHSARALDACFQATVDASGELRRAAQDKRLVLENYLLTIAKQLSDVGATL